MAGTNCKWCGNFSDSWMQSMALGFGIPTILLLLYAFSWRTLVVTREEEDDEDDEPPTTCLSKLEGKVKHLMIKFLNSRLMSLLHATHTSPRFN